MPGRVDDDDDTVLAPHRRACGHRLHGRFGIGTLAVEIGGHLVPPAEAELEIAPLHGGEHVRVPRVDAIRTFAAIDHETVDAGRLGGIDQSTDVGGNREIVGAENGRDADWRLNWPSGGTSTERQMSSAVTPAAEQL